MSEDSRSTLTGALWFFSAIALVALFISAAAQGELTPGHIILACVLLTFAMVGSIALLRMKDTETTEEKAKRQDIDRLIHDMSDDELIALKRRLMDADYSQDRVLDYVDDDGELVLRR